MELGEDEEGEATEEDVDVVDGMSDNEEGEGGGVVVVAVPAVVAVPVVVPFTAALALEWLQFRMATFFCNGEDTDDCEFAIMILHSHWDLLVQEGKDMVIETLARADAFLLLTAELCDGHFSTWPPGVRGANVIVDKFRLMSDPSHEGSTALDQVDCEWRDGW